MPEPKRVAVYCRCSTAHQDVAMQREQLVEYAQRRGWMVHRVYEDRGISGSRDRRPELDAMMKDVRRKAVDVVLVWRFDRFARSVVHLVNALNEFQSLGLDFVSLHESVDTSTPTGRVLFSVIAAISEFERSIIRERVAAGVERARAAGVKFGRRRAAFDYGRAVELFKAGSSYREIARQMGVGSATVHRALRSVRGVPNVA